MFKFIIRASNQLKDLYVNMTKKDPKRRYTISLSFTSRLCIDNYEVIKHWNKCEKAFSRLFKHNKAYRMDSITDSTLWY